MTEKFGRYDILEQIGQGGFAVVYRAYDTQLDRHVALKELRPMLLADSDSIKNFRQEARNIARLDHPQVVTIYDIYQLEQRQFIVMQLVDGASLEERLTAQDALPWPEAVEIITALAAGLDYAHAQNTLHRDLKPANILLDSKHGPMLSDFGLAKLIGQASTNLSLSGTVVGTPHYIAPEVWEGQGASRQSDIYALGCILYEMLVGQKLFPGETPPAVMMAHFKALTLPDAWPEGVPAGTAGVLKTALAQNPAHRYASAAELSQALAALMPPVERVLAPSQPESAPVEPTPTAPPLLTTKLYPPPTRPEFVPRPRLIEQLNEGLRSGRKLTLISASAGFGKTTLVSSWLFQNDEPPVSPTHHSNVAWLSLDEGDNNLSRFLTYLISALQTTTPDFGAGVLAMLSSPQPPPTESILTALLNDVAALPDKIILVLDDYHVIETKTVDDALTFLLEHVPPHLHLVIATRQDPPLPLPRLRVRGQLTELRAADLRFTPDEAAAFLNQAMGLKLAADDIAALETRTEGWIAGLQLAALSMQGHQDAPGFIDSFTGSHHFVMDYLLEEVLHRQPEQIQTFLLRTSILERLCGPLCEAVLDAAPASGQQTLEYLQQANLFLIPLDNERRWYRYHHLFADLLRQRLHQSTADVARWHLRASLWFEENDLPAEAIHHALAAKDFERTAALLELIWPTMSGSFQSAIWLDWAGALPEPLIRARPVLAMACAWALLDGGQLEAGEHRLQDVERWLDDNPTPAGEMVVVDQAQFRTLPGSLATARSYLALAFGDGPGSVKYARQVLDLSPEDDLIRRGQAASLLALAHWTGGELEEAFRILNEAMANFRSAGQTVFAISGTYGLADIKLTQGRLRAALTIYEQALRLVEDENEATLPGTADLYLGLGDLHRELGDLAAATRYLAHSEALGEPAGLPDWPYRFRLAQSRLELAQGEPDNALALLAAAERFYFRSPMPEVRPLAALKARLWLALNRLPEAQRWAQEQKLSVDDDLSYLREFEHITLARLLIARYKNDQTEQRFIEQAISLLARLLEAAEAGRRMGSAIEILVLQALARQAQDDISSALEPLEQALSLAEPEGYIRTFVDEGPPMAELLFAAAARGVAPDYINRLLAAFPNGGATPAASADPQAALVEPLSDRELEVLQLVAQGLSNRQISERLFLALDTVKGHNRRIFGKLQVKRRTEAVARAQALGLL